MDVAGYLDAQITFYEKHKQHDRAQRLRDACALLWKQTIDVHEFLALLQQIQGDFHNHETLLNPKEALTQDMCRRILYWCKRCLELRNNDCMHAKRIRMTTNPRRELDAVDIVRYVTETQGMQKTTTPQDDVADAGLIAASKGNKKKNTKTKKKRTRPAEEKQQQRIDPVLLYDALQLASMDTRPEYRIPMARAWMLKVSHQRPPRK